MVNLILNMMILQMQKRAVLSLFFLFLGLSIQIQAQKRHQLEVDYKVGDQELMEMSVNQDITTVAEGMSMNMINNVTMWVNQVCVAVTAEGNFKLEQEIKRMKISFSMMGYEMTLDTDKEPTKDDEKMYQTWESFRVLVGAKIIVVLGKNAKIISSEPDEKFELAIEKAGAGLNSDINNIVLPTKAVAIGESWKQTINNGIKGVNMEINAESQLAQVKQKIASISIKGNITPMKLEGIEINSGDIKGMISLDLKKKRMIQSDLYFNFEMTSKEGGKELPMTIKQKVTRVYTEQ